MNDDCKLLIGWPILVYRRRVSTQTTRLSTPIQDAANRNQFSDPLDDEEEEPSVHK